jgi:hypothetical protein
MDAKPTSQGRFFSGKSQASLIAAILEHEPEPISKRAPLRPRSLDRMVGRCLAKDPPSRWSLAHEVREFPAVDDSA